MDQNFTKNSLRALKTLSRCCLPEHKLQFFFSYQASEKSLQRVFPLLEALTQGYDTHSQSWSQRCQVNAVRVV